MKIRTTFMILLILLGISTVVNSPLSVAGDSREVFVLDSGGLKLHYDNRSRKLTIGPDGDLQPLLMEGFGKYIIPGSIRAAGARTLSFELGAFQKITGTISAVNDGGFEFTLEGNGKMSNEFAFPDAITAYKNQSWVVPDNEGLLIPATDRHYTIWEWGKPFYQGHGGFSMPFIGITGGQSGYLLIVETPDDCRAKLKKPSGNKGSAWSIVWEPSRQEWRYLRKFLIRYVPSGGYVAIAKAYREYAKTKGLVVTLREKAKTNPNVDKLIGAADLWFWKKADYWQQEPDCRKIAMEIKNAGIERVLWSNEANPQSVEAMNQLGFLTGRYDIYQDVYSPETPIDWVNKEGWPEALVRKSDGGILNGWVTRYEGREYTGGVICSLPALDMVHNHVPPDLQTHPYTARFIDTSTASPLRECYNPQHPETRSEDRIYKAQLLDYLSGELKLVTGCETGIDWAVPYLHYFEGMMSIANYRLADSGYDLISIKKPQPDFLRFQTGPYYRIPLFELVYHDCVVSYWYWGDSSNRLPDYWDTRDLFNLLYGTGPLWIMDYERWQAGKERFVKSYQIATMSARRTGYAEMTDHQFLTADHTVQYTEFADGTRIWVNFGTKAYELNPNVVLSPKSYRIQ